MGETNVLPNRWAVIRLNDGSTYRGIVYAVDPESGHVVMLETGQGDADVRPVVLFSASIASVSQHDTEEALAADVQLVHSSGLAQVEPETRAAVHTRQRALRAVLLSERVPFEETTDGEFVVLGCLRCAAPFTRSTIHCENEIVLDRFLSLFVPLLQQRHD